jgi:AcrR family transcriptional regulator
VGVTVEQRSKGERRRLEVLEHARAHLIQVGLEGFSLRHVADSVGITLGNLQYYFPTRDDLLAAVVRAEIDADTASIRSVSTADPVAALADAAHSLIERWSGASGNVYVTLGLLAQHRPALAELAAEAWSAAYDEIARLVRLADPSVTPTEARARAMVVISLLDGASFQHYAPTGRLARRRITSDIVDTAVSIALGRTSHA